MKIQHIALVFLLSLAASTAVAADNSEVVVTFTDSPVNFDPHHSFTTTEAQIFTAIYEGLVTYHPIFLSPVPGVADRWEVNADGTEYLFHIRDDARWWNGDRVTAEQFRDSWLRLIDPEQEGTYASLLDIVKGARDYRTGKNADPNSVGIEVTDDGRLKVTLENPADHFLRLLCHHSFVPVHPDNLDAQGRWVADENLIGNGPYQFSKKTADEWFLRPADAYWDRESVKNDGLRFFFVPDDKTAEYHQRFNDRQIQWLNSQLNLDLIDNEDYVVVHELFSTSYYFFDSATHPFDDRRVRRGLSLLLPWDEIRDAERYHAPTASLVPELENYVPGEGITEPDPEAGLELLSEAGFPGGEGLPDIVVAIPLGNADDRRIADLMQTAWQDQLSVQVRIREIPYRQYYDSFTPGQFTLATLTWIGDFTDPLSFLELWTSESNLNDGGYASPDYDALIDRATREKGDRRLKTLSEAETLLLSDAAVLPINHGIAVNVVNTDRLDGWYPNALDIHPFKYFQRKIPMKAPGLVDAENGSLEALASATP